MDISYDDIIIKSYNETRNIYNISLKNEIKKAKILTSLENSLIYLYIDKNFKHKGLLNSENVIIMMNNVIITYNNLKFYNHKLNNYNEILKYIKQLVNIVDYLHSINILIGDISLDNILIDDDQLKLFDFSQSLIDSNHKSFIDQNLYKENYRPPEVWYGNSLSLYSDIWCLGCVIYEMIYGEQLFETQNSYEQYMIQIHQWNMSIKTGKFSIPLSDSWDNDEYKEINKLLLRMLSVDFNDRPTINEISEFFGLKSYTKKIIKYNEISCNYLNKISSNNNINYLIMNLYNKIKTKNEDDRNDLNTLLVIFTYLFDKTKNVLFKIEDNIILSYFESIIDYEIIEYL